MLDLWFQNSWLKVYCIFNNIIDNQTAINYKAHEKCPLMQYADDCQPSLQPEYDIA